MNTTLYSSTGTKSTQDYKINSDISNLEIKNFELIKLNYVANLSNQRKNLAKTKTRGLVRGGGKKPWSQKGLGRARFGSSRNPIWRGGGIAFGPTGQENYTKKVNKKAKIIALKQALHLALKDNRVSVIEDIKLKDHKTKQSALLIKKLQLKSPLLVVSVKSDPKLLVSFRNLKDVNVIELNHLNVNNLLDYNSILFFKDALDTLSTKLVANQRSTSWKYLV